MKFKPTCKECGKECDHLIPATFHGRIYVMCSWCAADAELLKLNGSWYAEDSEETPEPKN